MVGNFMMIVMVVFYNSWVQSFKMKMLLYLNGIII